MVAMIFFALDHTQARIDLGLASRYFQEAQWISDDDAGNLWGRQLAGPIVFVEPGSRQAVTNQEPAGAGFQRVDGLWAGTWPSDRPVANTAIEWLGKRWTMVSWPLPTQRTERARLLAHEMFHRVQSELELQTQSAQNAHMDTMEGRLWLRVEIAALAKALGASGTERTKHARNALAFRVHRQSIFPGSKEQEDQLELNEGLAEFTGLMLKGGWEPEVRLWQSAQLALIAESRQPTYSRRFAYWTGSAYALLLNVEEAVRRAETNWRRRLTSKSSLSDELATVIKWAVPEGDIAELAVEYGYRAILADEELRSKDELRRIEELTARFVDGPVLVVPNIAMQFSFDPGQVFALGSLGSVYGTATIMDAWGTLSVSDGVLISPDFSSFRVPAPAAATDLHGPGWQLELKTGWRLVPGSRKGDFRVERAQ